MLDTDIRIIHAFHSLRVIPLIIYIMFVCAGVNRMTRVGQETLCEPITRFTRQAG